MNYSKLIQLNPTTYGVIEFVEHPLKGDEAPVICVCHDLNLAMESEFWDLEDMMASHKEYEPYFENGHLLYDTTKFI
jgi:hypothetical protein